MIVKRPRYWELTHWRLEDVAVILKVLLSHPSLGWLYVFSSFSQLPQWLLLLTSIPFELDLRYLGLRKYGSRKMYWVTFWWLWPKVMAVTLINKNLLVCRVKWEPLNQSLQNFVDKSLWSWSSPDFGGILLETLFFAKFSSKILDVFFQGQTLYWTYLRNGWSDWCERKRILGELCDLDLWPCPWPWPLIFQGQI